MPARARTSFLGAEVVPKVPRMFLRKKSRRWPNRKSTVHLAAGRNAPRSATTPAHPDAQGAATAQLPAVDAAAGMRGGWGLQPCARAPQATHEM